MNGCLLIELTPHPHPPSSPISVAPRKGTRPPKSHPTNPHRTLVRLRKSRLKNKEKLQASDPMSDVQILDSPGIQETEKRSDVEFADFAYPKSKLVPDMLSERAHYLLDKKVLGRYPWIDDEKAKDSIYPRITLLRSLARDYNQLNPRGIRWCLENHPWLVSVLNKCWRKGSFRTIRLLSEYIGGTRNPQLIFPCLPTYFCIQRFYSASICHNGRVKNSSYKVCHGSIWLRPAFR